MAVKPHAKDCVIKEQIVEDKVTGITLQFQKLDAIPEKGLKEEVKLTIYGDILPLGNRDIIFDENGEKCAGGTATGDTCRPSWLRRAKA